MSILNIKFDLVEVTWDDASSLEHGWVDPNDEKPQPQLVKTVGFLVNESEHYLVIASTTDGSWVNGRFQIPKGMVRSCKPLRRKRKAKESGLAKAKAEAARLEANGAKPIEPKPAEPARGTGAEPVRGTEPARQAPAALVSPAAANAPTVLEDLLAKAGAAAALKPEPALAESEVPRAA